MSRAPNSRTVSLLDQMPCLLDDIPQWFGELSDSDFNLVCLSAITSYVADEQTETGFISVTSVTKFSLAIQNRYRKICGLEVNIIKKPAYVYPRGEQSATSKLNEWQVRIVRRTGRCVNDIELAKVFGVHPSTLTRARSGKSWRHLLNGNSLCLSQHRT